MICSLVVWDTFYWWGGGGCHLLSLTWQTKTTGDRVPRHQGQSKAAQCINTTLLPVMFAPILPTLDKVEFTIIVGIVIVCVNGWIQLTLTFNSSNYQAFNKMLWLVYCHLFTVTWKWHCMLCDTCTRPACGHNSHLVTTTGTAEVGFKFKIGRKLNKTQPTATRRMLDWMLDSEWKWPCWY